MPSKKLPSRAVHSRNTVALAAAIELAKRGMPVFPCARTKRPLTPHGHIDATIEVKLIKRWWRQWPFAMVGVPTGRRSGLLVIDVDPNGRSWLATNEYRLDAKRVHRTKRGYHLLYRVASDVIGNSVGKIAAGVDVRGEGGYIIWWPAEGEHVEGGLDAIGEVPAWLRDQLDASETKPSRLREDSASVGKGGRNVFLSGRAYHLRKEGLSVREIESILQALNVARCQPPLDSEEVHRIAVNKEKVDPERPWHKPTPLVRSLPEAAAYPTHALGPILAPAAEAIIEIAQVPAAIAGSALLAAAALGAQRCSNVETLGGEKPLSIYALTIAGSGDRKTTVDRIALVPIAEHRKELAKEHRSQLEVYRREMAEVKRLPQDGGDAHRAEPEAPRKPWVLSSEPTAEGLFLSLLEGQFSQGVFNDEGATFIGGHALSEEAELRTIGMLSRAWDGSPLDRVRSINKENVTLYGRRLSMHLMAQPSVAARLLQNTLYRQQGFLARWLIAFPDSIVGTRQFDPHAPAVGSDLRLAAYNQSIKRLLTRRIGESQDLGGLELHSLQLSGRAKAILTSFYDEFESAQKPGGSLEQGREWASKAAEHACRVAGVLSLVGDSDARTVKAAAMRRAVKLVRHYMSEYLRLVGTANVSVEMEQAELLRGWLITRHRTDVTVRYIVQRGPAWIREAKKARAVLATLAEFGWVRQEGSKYLLHPDLLKGTA
jgi:hypothetical protein